MKPYCFRLLCLLSLLSTRPLFAQFGVYGKLDLVHDSDLTYAGDSGSVDTLYGFGVGAYDDFLHAGPIRAGVDLRVNLSSGGSYDYRAILGGARVSVKVPAMPVKPYAEILAGTGGAKYTGSLAYGISSAPYSNKFLYEILGGIELTIFPHVDWRVVEAGVGRQTGVSSELTAPTSTLTLVSTGLVLRF